MKHNVGTKGKIFRIIIALIFFSIGLYYKTWWGLLGFFPLVIAVSGWCPLYPLLGIGKKKQ